MGELQRTFVILGHQVPLTPDFTLNDLPGSAGRLDILARCVTSALCLSHGLRADTDVHLVLQNAVVVTFEGARVKRLNPDERSTGALVKHALSALQSDRSESTPGVQVRRDDLASVLAELEAQDAAIYPLQPDGRDIREAPLAERAAFVLSDHQDFAAEESTTLADRAPISLGPQILQADHCIPIVHNELDRRSLSRL